MKPQIKYSLEWRVLIYDTEYTEDSVTEKNPDKLEEYEEENPLVARKKALNRARQLERWFDGNPNADEIFDRDDDFIIMFGRIPNKEDFPYGISVYMKEVGNTENKFLILGIGNESFTGKITGDDDEVLQGLLKEYDFLERNGIKLNNDRLALKYFDNKDKKEKQFYILPNGIEWKNPEINLLHGAEL